MDVVRYATIALGSLRVIAIESLAFAVFTLVSFVWAVRAFREHD